MKKEKFYKSSAWKWFSRYIKLKYAREYNGQLYCQCATSGKWFDLYDSVDRKKLHLGHYIKVYNGNSTNFSTAFDERNVAPQRDYDNRKLGGNQIKMREFLVAKFGEKNIYELEALSKQPKKIDGLDLKILSKVYREKYNKLSIKKGNPWKD